MKEIEEDTNKWEIVQVHGVEKLILKCYYQLPKASHLYRFKAVSIKITLVFSLKVGEKKKNPKIYVEPQETPNSQSNPERKLEASHFLISNYITKL